MPLVLAGSQAAHALAYDARLSRRRTSASVLLATGHGYLTWLPLVLALAGAVALVALLVARVDAARGQPARDAARRGRSRFLPPATFVVQEVLELSLHTGTFGWHALLAPTFLPGLALQLPFALARLPRGAAAAARGRSARPRARAAAASSAPASARRSLPLRRRLRARARVAGCARAPPPCAVVAADPP